MNAEPLPLVWSYGYGVLDEQNHTLSNYQDLPFCDGSQYQGGRVVPDPALGWVFLTADGGHPGNDHKHVAVMRWTAPETMTVSVSGTLSHDKEPGDGVRGHIFATGKLIAGPWNIHQTAASTDVKSVDVQKGDTLDFVVDIYRLLNHDSFSWSPTIVQQVETATAGANPNKQARSWNYTQDFQSLESPALAITPLQNVAQVLLMSNEFHFVD